MFVLGLQACTESHIDAIYYFEKWSSAARWRSPQQMHKELSKLSSRTRKLEELKEQIRIRVLGLGWSDLATPWSKECVSLSPEQLASHLKTIMAAEKTRPIPLEPPVDAPVRKKLPTLGVRSMDAVALDARQDAVCAMVKHAGRSQKQQREVCNTTLLKCSRTCF